MYIWRVNACTFERLSIRRYPADRGPSLRSHWHAYASFFDWTADGRGGALYSDVLCLQYVLVSFTAHKKAEARRNRLGCSRLTVA